jgi:hypothetical protein
MPELLKSWYEQPVYHKILPFVCNLSMKISRAVELDDGVLEPAPPLHVR